MVIALNRPSWLIITMAKLTTTKGIKIKGRCPLTSVGFPFVDDLLGGGLPINGIYLVDECNSRNYASVLEKYFIAEGISHSHKILVASPQLLAFNILRTLPEKILTDQEESGSDHLQDGKDGNDDHLRIAWRYSSVPKLNSFNNAKKGILFDLSKHITIPDSCKPLLYPDVKNVSEIPSCSYHQLWSVLQQEFIQYSTSSSDKQKTLFRIVVEDFGSLFWEDGSQALRFLGSLRALVSEHFAVVMIIINSDAMSCEMRDRIYSYGDAVFRLETVEDQSHYGEASEKFDGYFRIVKLPTVFSIACSLPENTDLLFELHKKYLQIRVQHLPPSFVDSKASVEMQICPPAEQF